VLALIVGNGRHWSIYRRSGDLPWRKDQEAEIVYRRGVEDDWRAVVRGIDKLSDEDEARYADDLDRCWRAMSRSEQNEAERAITPSAATHRS